MKHLSTTELHEGLPLVQESPKDNGQLQLIVRRPKEDEREVLEIGQLSTSEGLVGDDWINRGSRRTADGGPHPDMQINIMNARAAQLVAQDVSRWGLAGDQLYIDIDLSDDNLPPGTRIKIGDQAVLEITDIPHNGCKKFVERFGKEAMLFVNSEVGKKHHLRGINAKVIEAGSIRKGDIVTKL